MFLYFSRFVSYRSVRDAEEAISNTDEFDFGFEKKLRVRLSHGKKDDAFANFIPQNIDIKLGGDYIAETEAVEDKDLATINETPNSDSGNGSDKYGYKYFYCCKSFALYGQIK